MLDDSLNDFDARYDRDLEREPTYGTRARLPMNERGTVKQWRQHATLADHDWDSLRRDGFMAAYVANGDGKQLVLDCRTCTECRKSFSKTVTPTTEAAFECLRAEGHLMRPRNPRPYKRTVSVTAATHALLEAEAKKCGVSMGQLVAEACKDIVSAEGN